MMSPEQLERLKNYVQRLSDESLMELLRFTMAETIKRGRKLKQSVKPSQKTSLKDCGPDRED